MMVLIIHDGSCRRIGGAEVKKELQTLVHVVHLEFSETTSTRHIAICSYNQYYCQNSGSFPYLRGVGEMNKH